MDVPVLHFSVLTCAQTLIPDLSIILPVGCRALNKLCQPKPMILVTDPIASFEIELNVTGVIPVTGLSKKIIPTSAKSPPEYDGDGNGGIAVLTWTIPAC